jgi:hypothetical protein
MGWFVFGAVMVASVASIAWWLALTWRALGKTRVETRRHTVSRVILKRPENREDRTRDLRPQRGRVPRGGATID